MKKLNEGSFHIFSEIPPKSKWLKSGTVDRQTSATDFVWQRRFMILTADDVVFAKPDSDVVVDRLPLLSVNFVGKVDNVREEHSQETATWSSFRKKKKIKRKNSVTALFTPAARPTLSDNAANPGDKSSKGSSFAFEICTASEDRERSYFCRTATSEEREEWLAAVLSAVAAAASQKTQRNGAVERLQSRASALCESPLAKYVVTAAILVDFFSSVPAHAPPPPTAAAPPPQSRSESRRRRPKAARGVLERRDSTPCRDTYLLSRICYHAQRRRGGTAVAAKGGSQALPRRRRLSRLRSRWPADGVGYPNQGCTPAGRRME